MGRALDKTQRWSGKSDYITTSGTSQQSAAFGANTHEIRVVVIGNACHINIGDNPTAAASDNNGMLLPVGVVEYFHVTPGQKVAVIQETGAGTFCVSEMTR